MSYIVFETKKICNITSFFFLLFQSSLSLVYLLNLIFHVTGLIWSYLVLDSLGYCGDSTFLKGISSVFKQMKAKNKDLIYGIKHLENHYVSRAKWLLFFLSKCFFFYFSIFSFTQLIH